MIQEFLESISHLPARDMPSGQLVMRQGERRGQLWVLLSGEVEILKNDVPICRVGERGAIFGELSVLLRVYQLATVRTTKDSTFHVVENAEEFLAANAVAAVVLARMLAKRLALLDSSFSQLKKDFQRLQAEEEESSQPQGGGTQLVGKFIADAERSFDDPTSPERA